MLQRCFFILFLFTCFVHLASAKFTVDTNYIKTYTQTTYFKAYTGTSYNSINIKSPNINSEDTSIFKSKNQIIERYHPDTKITLGLGASFKNLAISFGFGINLNRTNETSYGFNFQTSYFGRRFLH